MSLYVIIDVDDWREATPAEYREAARPHVDHETLLPMIDEKYGDRMRGPGGVWMIDPRALARDILDAALGADNE